MRGVITLRNQYVTQNESCAHVAHRQKLAANERESFFALGVIVIRQRDIVGLKPVASIEGRRIAIDVSAVQFRSSRSVMMIPEHFQFVCDQISDPRRNIRFARGGRSVMLGNAAVEDAAVFGFPPSLGDAASRAKRFGNQRVFLFLRKLRRRPSWIFPARISDCSRYAATGDPTLQLSVELAFDSTLRFPEERRVFIKKFESCVFDGFWFSISFGLLFKMFERINPQTIPLEFAWGCGILE